MSNDADNRDLDDGYWENGGWRWDTGSNHPIPTDKAEVNHQELVCWVETVNDEEETCGSTGIPRCWSRLHSFP